MGVETVGDVGEFGLITALVDRLAQGPDVVVGPGDDAAVLDMPGGRVLVSTDLLVEGRHFRRDWSSAADIGHRAAAASLADMMAMGGRATALVVGLGAPADLPTGWALELADGLAEEAAAVGASVVGGDVTGAKDIVVAVTAIGGCERGEPILRAGANPGDVVAVCGRLGWAAAGLAVLARGFRSPRSAVAAYRRPEPPYDAGPQAVELGATAAIDVSDGLLADLGHIAGASGAAIDVSRAAFEVPEPLQAVGAAIGVDPRGFPLTGGDDHALAATFPPQVRLPDPWRVVGVVREGQGVTVDGSIYDGPAGHEHFR